MSVSESSSMELCTHITHHHIELGTGPGGKFYLTHPFLDLVSAQTLSWQTAHVQVGGVVW